MQELGLIQLGVDAELFSLDFTIEVELATALKWPARRDGAVHTMNQLEDSAVEEQGHRQHDLRTV
ncbi:MAG: hypothetical protein ACXWPI_15685 [Ktedonobacterales bacterium]